MTGPLELLNESDNIYLKFGADTNVYGIDKQEEIEKSAARPSMPT